jgi:NAD(P)-dependent dehydrogenase (short-subunit alcohol dehydrogenase family)
VIATMNIDLKGKLALITGASKGIGLAIANALAAEGCNLHLAARDEAALQQTAQRLRDEHGVEVTVHRRDLSLAAEVEALGEACTDVDILVNNAGILRDKSFAKMEIADFEKVVGVHLMGSAICAKAVWSGMRDRGYGRIVFTSSASGIYGNFGQANYGAAKAAMIGLMNVLHLEGAKYDIRVNVLAPTAATGMTAGLLPPEIAALLTPESVTPAVLFLVGENAPSRIIMGAGGGVFAVTHIEETPGVFLPEAERTPEKIAACFAEIADRASAVPLENAYAQTFKFAAAAKGMGVALPR